jgi:hypothetical protein
MGASYQKLALPLANNMVGGGYTGWLQTSCGIMIFNIYFVKQSTSTIIADMAFMTIRTNIQRSHDARIPAFQTRLHYQWLCQFDHVQPR